MSIQERAAKFVYGEGRPNTVGRALNSLWAQLGATGIGPDRLVSLEVDSHRTGRPMLVPLMVADLDGQRYLVSMLGERATWVDSVRAVDGNVLLTGAHREDAHLTEVPVPERAPILKRYLEVATGARPHLPVPHDAPVSAFEPIAKDYPVFRIEHIPGTPIERPLPPPLLSFAGAFALQRLLCGKNVSLKWAPVGVVLTAAGAGVAWIGLREIVQAGTTVDATVPERATTLVTTGVYQRTRNPMYVGGASVLLGHAAYRGKTRAFIPAAAFIMLMHYLQIPREEWAMEKRFGDAYAEYAKYVPRWV